MSDKSDAARNLTVDFITRRLQGFEDRVGKLTDEIEVTQKEYVAALIEEVVLAPGGLPVDSQARTEDFKKKLEGLFQARKTVVTNLNNLQSLKTGLEKGSHAKEMEQLAAKIEEMERLD